MKERKSSTKNRLLQTRNSKGIPRRVQGNTAGLTLISSSAGQGKQKVREWDLKKPNKTQARTLYTTTKLRLKSWTKAQLHNLAPSPRMADFEKDKIRKTISKKGRSPRLHHLIVGKALKGQNKQRKTYSKRKGRDGRPRKEYPFRNKGGRKDCGDISSYLPYSFKPGRIEQLRPLGTILSRDQRRKGGIVPHLLGHANTCTGDVPAATPLEEQRKGGARKSSP